MNNARHHQPDNNINTQDAGRIAVGTKAAAKLLGVSRNTLYAWVHAGLVPHIRVGSHILFSVKQLEAWVAGANCQANQGPGR